MDKAGREKAFEHVFGAALEAAAKQAAKGTTLCPNSGATIYSTQRKRLRGGRGDS